MEAGEGVTPGKVVGRKAIPNNHIMRKSIITWGVAALVATSADAQTKGFISGQMSVSSTSSPDDNAKTLNGTFGPMAGFNLSEKLILGLGVDYSGTTVTNRTDASGITTETDRKSSLLTIAPFARYMKKVDEDFSLFGQRERGARDYSAGIGREGGDQGGHGAGFEPGIAVEEPEQFGRVLRMTPGKKPGEPGVESAAAAGIVGQADRFDREPGPVGGVQGRVGRVVQDQNGETDPRGPVQSGEVGQQIIEITGPVEAWDQSPNEDCRSSGFGVGVRMRGQRHLDGLEKPCGLVGGGCGQGRSV